MTLERCPKCRSAGLALDVLDGTLYCPICGYRDYSRVFVEVAQPRPVRQEAQGPHEAARRRGRPRVYSADAFKRSLFYFEDQGSWSLSTFVQFLEHNQVVAGKLGWRSGVPSQPTFSRAFAAILGKIPKGPIDCEMPAVVQQLFRKKRKGRPYKHPQLLWAGYQSFAVSSSQSVTSIAARNTDLHRTTFGAFFRKLEETPGIQGVVPHESRLSMTGRIRTTRTKQQNPQHIEVAQGEQRSQPQRGPYVRGQKLRIYIYGGVVVERIFLHQNMNGIVVVCREEEYQASLREGRRPVAIGFHKEDIVPADRRDA